MVQNLHSTPGLGKSDHSILKFSLVGYSKQTPSATQKLALNRCNYVHLAELAHQLSWTVPNNSCIVTHFKTLKGSL